MQDQSSSEVGTRKIRDLIVGGGAGPLVAFETVGLLLVAGAVVVALALRPPLLGWLGYAIVCMIVVALTTLSSVVAPRLRTSPQQPALAPDNGQRLLVVADAHCGSPGLWQEIYAHLDGAVALHVVVPVRVSHLHYLTNDESREAHESEERVRLAVGFLRECGIDVSGSAGSDDPLESVTDALAVFPASHVLLATSTHEASYWMERGLLAKARALTPLEVSHVVVAPSSSSADSVSLGHPDASPAALPLRAKSRSER